MNKVLTHKDVLDHLQSNATIGIGGWGARRKPMSLVREICQSDIRDLTVVSYGGPDVGLLCAHKKVKNLFLDLSLWMSFLSRLIFDKHVKIKKLR